MNRWLELYEQRSYHAVVFSRFPALQRIVPQLFIQIIVKY